MRQSKLQLCTGVMLTLFACTATWLTDPKTLNNSVKTTWSYPTPSPATKRAVPVPSTGAVCGFKYRYRTLEDSSPVRTCNAAKEEAGLGIRALSDRTGPTLSRQYAVVSGVVSGQAVQSGSRVSSRVAQMRQLRSLQLDSKSLICLPCTSLE